jgi:Zn-finger nucleic acid-binding protein
VGVAMEKKHLDGPGRGFTIDFCPRCGGIWFDRGEVAEVARRDRSALAGLLREAGARVNPPCHECGTPLDRNAESCAACGHKNIIACPVCDRAMERRPIEGLVLDVCRKCHGVWFDNAELTAIWRLSVGAAMARRPRAGLDAAGIGGDILLNGIFWAPDLVVHGGLAAGQAAGAVVEVAGEAAESVFEVIVGIIGGLFE